MKNEYFILYLSIYTNIDVYAGYSILLHVWWNILYDEKDLYIEAHQNPFLVLVISDEARGWTQLTQLEKQIKKLFAQGKNISHWICAALSGYICWFLI